MLEWIRFGAICAFLLAAIVLETLAIFGVNRFRYCLNRLHAAAIGDTLGLTCVIVAAVIYVGFEFLSLKLLFVEAFLWLTSPISGHLISYLIYKTDESLDKEAKLWNS